ncbi:RHS repeat-associated core domain-containing protein [Streptoalloteichus hindustanus]|uniref:Intein C-terminal splicing region/RHS repeat-associated core domain-containing protein n=1 Tax=Streptoalloteichus hindustanus TaxID=2017 RepID=A0A1M5KU28_STRHI|nr:RHS repeat-associated core domain-containing protein [Streptoalloteichus hindustanus]SHG56304.1 intein C-terminal splicing region/RHS repeat-associated core domain-containing protein [Streptoalloteichus hindustanus]
MILALLLGVVGPSAAEVMPPFGGLAWAESKDPRELAPPQEWGTAKKDEPHTVEGEGANRAEPLSDQGKHPQLAAQPDPKPRNEVRAVDAPTQVRGFDSASSRELADRRGAHERTYQNADGTRTTEFSRDPIHYRKPDGAWAPIETVIVRDGAEWRNTADQVDIRFAARSGQNDLVRMRLDGNREFAFGVADAGVAQGEVNGSAITYAAIRPESDLRVDVVPGAVKETLVLRSPKAPRTWLFPLRLKGLSAKTDGDQVLLLDGEGKERARIPRGFMTDSKVDPTTGDPTTSYGVTYKLVDHNGQQALAVELDQAWLDDPARQYPVSVDPTVATVNSSESMYVEKSTSGYNKRFDGAQELRVGRANSGGVDLTAASYVKFGDLGPGGSLHNHKIFGAQLYLTNYWSWSCQPRPVTVHPVLTDWGTGGYPGPGVGDSLAEKSFAHGYIGLGQSASPCPTTPELIDLGEGGRDLVQRWVKGEQVNHGLSVRASETDVFGWKKFAGHGTANPPRLFVTHTEYDAEYRIDRGTPEPPVLRNQGGRVKITVTNRGANTWGANDFALGYRAFTAGGSPVKSPEAASLPHDVAPGQSVTLEPYVQPMEPGDYLLDFSMFRRGGAYFTDEQIRPARLAMSVFNIEPIVKAQYPPSGHAAPTLTPQLWVDAVDVDAPPGSALQYRFEICRRGADGNPFDCWDSGRVGQRTWTVPKGKLRWGQTYLWRAFAWDGETENQKLDFSVLTTSVPQPEITSHLGGAPYSTNDRDFDPQVGNYSSSAVDASVKVTGPDLTVARTYNSQDPRRDLAFGAGWSTRYDMRIVPDGDGSGNVVVTYPDGQQVRFGANADGLTYAPPPGRFATLFRVGDQSGGGWRLVDKVRNVYTFRPDGKLVSIHDNANRWIELDYNTGGDLQRAISRTSNRTLHFTWAGGHVASVKTDAVDGKQITWTYKYEGDRLKEVCDPKGGCTKYEYGTGSHYRSAVLDSQPDSYWRLGEPSGDSATSQVAVNLGKDWGRFTDVALGAKGPVEGSPDTAATFNGRSSWVKLPEGSVRKSRDLALELWFRTTGSGPLAGLQTHAFTENPTGALPALYVGNDGKLRGQFWHGRVDPITTAQPVNDGKWHHVVLSGSLATQTMFLDGAKVGSTEGEIDLASMNHAQIGAAYTVPPSAWPEWGADAKRHFAGDIDEVALYQHPLGEAAARAHFEARRASDQITKVTTPGERIAAEVKYDVTNDRVSEVVDRDGGRWRIAAPVITGNPNKDDAQGRKVRNLIRTIQVTDPGNRLHVYDYDPIKGRILRSVAPLGVGAREEDKLGSTGTPVTTPSATPCPSKPTPNPDGSPHYCGGQSTNDPSWVGGPVQGLGVRSFDYDESGFQHTITDENGNQVVLKHDERGNVLSRTTCRGPGNCQTVHNTYHLPPKNGTDDNNPVNDKLLTKRDGRSSGPADDTYRTAYTYTATGDLETQTNPDGSQVRHTYTDGSTAAEGGGNEPPALVKTTTDARGAKTTYRYYANGDVAETIDPAGLRTRYRYDVLGRKVEETEVSDSFPGGLTTSYVYDERGRVVAVTEPPTTDAVNGAKHQRRTVTAHNADGDPVWVQVSDVTGGDQTRMTVYDYDRHGRQSKVTDAEGNATYYGFDAFGNRTWVVNPNGTKIEYAYTARNKLAEVRLRGWHGKPVSPDESGRPGDGEGDKNVGETLLLNSYVYDLGGRLAKHTDAMGRQTEYRYHGDNLLWRVRALQVRQADGSKKDVVLEENSYDAAGNLTKRVGPGGRATVHEVNATGRITATTVDPENLKRRTEFRYDANGNVLQVVKSGNFSNAGSFQATAAEVVDYEYDAAGRQTAEKLRNGFAALTTTRRYDQHGRVVAETDPRGNAPGAKPADFTTEFRYDEEGREVQEIAPTVQVESAGRAPSAARPTKFTGYNTFGETVATKDENGNVGKRSYDRTGRLVEVESPGYTQPGASEPVRSVSRNRYDHAGNLVETTDPRGAVTRYRYDQLGRLLERQDPKPDKPGEGGGTWRYTYTHTGERLSETDPQGARTEATYDELGRKITQSQLERRPVAAAHTSKYEYDLAGNLVAETSPTGDVVRHAYDVLGQRISTTDPAGVVTQFGYDGAGRPNYGRDGLGRTSFSQRDAAGRLVTQADYDANGQLLRRVKAAHDAAGNVVARTDAQGHTTKYAFDALNRLVQQVEPVSDTETITTSFGYDAKGNRTRYTDGRGNVTTYSYNSWSLAESVVEPATQAHPEAKDRTWTAIYDAAGNTVKQLAPGGVTRDRQFDALNRLTKETGSGAETATSEKVFEYDQIGQLTSLSAPGGRNTFNYDDRRHLLSAEGPSGKANFEFDGDGRITARTDAAGTTRFGYGKGRLTTVADGITGVNEALSYNEAGQVSKVDYGTGRVREYGYDNLGRLASDALKNSAGTAVTSAVYEYNANNQLTRKATAGTAGAGDNTYGYDYAGRLTSWTVGGKTTQYAWDAASNRTRNGDKTASYDERNRLLADGDYTYKYTARGTLASRTSSGLEEKFTFDAFDRLIDVGKAKYEYDALDRVTNRNGQKFSYAGTEIDPVSDGITTYSRGPAGELLALAQGGDKRLLLSDKHGDVVGGFKPEGELTGLADSATYDPFGQVTATGGAKRAVGFQGDWTDPDTNQVNMGARWYNPGTGSFLSRDTVTASSGGAAWFNRYTYGVGSPLNFIDPDGHWSWGDVWDVGKKVVSGAVEVVKEVSGYNDVKNFIDEPSFGNFLWAASNFVPFGKVAKGVKYLAKYGDDLIGGARRYGDDLVGAGRRYGDDLAGAARRYGDDLAGAARRYGDNIAGAARRFGRGVAKYGKAAGRYGSMAARAGRAGISTMSAAAAAAARRAAQEAVTRVARQAAETAVRRNPIPVLQAALKPTYLMKDLVSSAPHLPAKAVQALKTDVQDLNKIYDTIKATIVKAGTEVIQSVAEQAVSELVSSVSPEAAAAIDLLGGPKGKRGAGQARASGRTARAEAATGCRVSGVGTASLDRHSFSPETPVLMADGSRKPIKDIQLGDQVMATDPTTGQTGIREVTDVRSHDSDNVLVEVTIDTDGQAGDQTGKLVATDEHPFWVESVGKWLHTKDLKPGYTFRTADNRPATVTGTRSFSEVRRVYNLTVDGLHTYYVLAGPTSVLAHNSNPTRAHKCGEVAVDTNAVTDALSGAKTTEVDAALAGRSPVLSPTAHRELLEGGHSADDIDGWLSARGGRMGPAATSEGVASLQARLRSMWKAKSFRPMIADDDAAVLHSAIQDGLSVITNDKRFYKNIERLGYSSERY